MGDRKGGGLRFSFSLSGIKVYPKVANSTENLQQLEWMKLLPVFSGSWAEKRAPLESWKQPPNKLMVFISSTFTDTHDERNILLEEVLPVFQKKGNSI